MTLMTLATGSVLGQEPDDASTLVRHNDHVNARHDDVGNDVTRDVTWLGV